MAMERRSRASASLWSTETVHISAAFEILGACRDPQGRGWGKWLRWRDNDGRVHLQLVCDGALQGDLAALCAGLASDGMWINRAQQRALATYLSGVPTNGRVTLVGRTDWHDIGRHSVFILPDKTIGPRGSEKVILDASAIGPYEARGSLKDWQQGVGALASGHALAVLAISAALAGPLLHLAGQEGGGVHIYGGSSTGKTTLLQMAASVWGRGATPGYMRAWRATANGLEGTAASATDTALIFDELGVVEARDAAASIYGLANGAGKVRAHRDGSLREPKSWRVLILSTGEIQTETKLAEDRGRKAHAGQLVRLLDIPTDRGKGFGVFDNAGPDGDPGKLANAFKYGAISSYGTAGPEFVRRIIAEGARELGATVRQEIGNFVASNVPAGADGQIERAAQRLGLIAAAGELATIFGITPWQEGEAREAAAWALERWIEGRGGTEPAEVRQAIEQIRLAIEQHGESRFDNLDDCEAKPVNNRLGWRRGSGPDKEWWIPPETWRKEICAGHDATMVARTLADRKMLRRQCTDTLQCTVKIGGLAKRAYVLTAAILDGGSDAG
jgi:putative DNA primase/helicase